MIDKEKLVYFAKKKSSPNESESFEARKAKGSLIREWKGACARYFCFGSRIEFVHNSTP